MDDQKTIEILCRALAAAPMPTNIEISSVHPEDVQKWSDRYKIWYQEIRTYVLNHLNKPATNSLYYQIDRLVQESKNIQAELKNEKEESVITAPPVQKGVVIGPVKRK